MAYEIHLPVTSHTTFQQQPWEPVIGTNVTKELSTIRSQTPQIGFSKPLRPQSNNPNISLETPGRKSNKNSPKHVAKQ